MIRQFNGSDSDIVFICFLLLGILHILLEIAAACK